MTVLRGLASQPGTDTVPHPLAEQGLRPGPIPQGPSAGARCLRVVGRADLLIT